MPYGIKNETPEQTQWMENCVDSITGTNKRTGKPYKEGEKIAICKWNLKQHGMKKDSASELSMKEELWDLENKIRDAIVGPLKETIQPSSGPWVDDIFDEFVIVSVNGNLFKVNYSVSGDTISVDWMSAVEVKRRIVYDPVTTSARKNINDGRIVTFGGRTVG